MNSIVHVEVSGLTGSGKSAVMGEIEIALKALGLKVEYGPDFQAEKNGTHADWQTALDLYRPTVVLAERNISRQPPAREDAPPPPTCQRCGGEVSGWVCQECDTPFTENDVGALVFDRLAAPSVWMFRVDGKWELSVIKPQALLNLAPEDVISVPISAQPTANFVAKAKHFLDLAEEAEVKALEGDEGCVWPVEALRAAYAALPFVMTITLGGDHAED